MNISLSLTKPTITLAPRPAAAVCASAEGHLYFRASQMNSFHACSWRVSPCEEDKVGTISKENLIEGPSD